MQVIQTKNLYLLFYFMLYTHEGSFYFFRIACLEKLEEKKVNKGKKICQSEIGKNISPLLQLCW